MQTQTLPYLIEFSSAHRINGKFKDWEKAPSKFLVHYFQIPPTPYFCKRRGEYKLCWGFLYPEDFLRICLQTFNCQSIDFFVAKLSVCKINFVGIILLCKQYATSRISIKPLDHLFSNGRSVQWLGTNSLLLSCRF